MSRHWLVITVLISILVQPLSVSAQESPTSLDGYLLPGERLITLKPSLHYRGQVYEIHYFSTNSFDRADSSVIGTASRSSFSDWGITGLMITADGVIVEDERTLYEVLVLYRTAYYLHEVAAIVAPGFTDSYPWDDFRTDLRWIVWNPLFVEQFVEGLFESRQEELEGALRAILVAQRPPPEDIEAFEQEVHRRLEARRRAGELADLFDAVDETLEAARFANYRLIRDVAGGLRGTFKSWRPVTEQGQSYVDIAGTRLEFFNALDVLSLGMDLMWISEYERDRSEWLDNYTQFASGAAGFDEDQLRATGVVLAESERSWVQRGNIILDFVEDQGVELGIRIVTDKLCKKYVAWAWQKYGKRIRGHRAAGAASAFLLGFTLADLLYGLDDLHSNFTIAYRSDELRRVFHAGRSETQSLAKTSQKDHYDGGLTARFRTAYMLESLAAAQALRSYGDGVDATVREGLLELLNPINWFKGKEWREAAAGLREFANDLEMEAEDKIGHPAFADVAVELALKRLGIHATPAVRDAIVTRNSGSLVLHPLESGEIVFEVQNIGNSSWPPGQGYALVNTNRRSLGASPVQTLTSEVPPGRIAQWVLPITAPSQIGLNWTEWQMAFGEEPFGAPMSCLVAVVPEGAVETNLMALLAEWLDELKQHIGHELDQFLQNLMNRFEEWLQRESERLVRQLLDNLTQQCCGAAALLPTAVLVAAWSAGCRRGKRMGDCDHD
jgi:hypothetical protein